MRFVPAYYCNKCMQKEFLSFLIIVFAFMPAYGFMWLQSYYCSSTIQLSPLILFLSKSLLWKQDSLWFTFLANVYQEAFCLYPFHKQNVQEAPLKDFIACVCVSVFFHSYILSSLITNTKIKNTEGDIQVFVFLFKFFFHWSVAELEAGWGSYCSIHC